MGQLRVYILFLVFVLSMAGVKAQQPLPDSLRKPPVTSNICGNDMLLYKLRKIPGFAAKEEKMNRQILSASGRSTDDIITLPVVVHIINTNPATITDASVINGIKDLNDAFGKTGNYAASKGADTKIRFCLSKKDPDGGITTGITRTKSFFSSHMHMDIEDDRLKNLIQWDPSHYINIWFVESIESELYASFSCGEWTRLRVGGYATMPPASGPLDGIVVPKFGTVLAHEMGHYLGLYHTFEGGCRNYNCETDGDMVCDTPPDGSMRPSFNCNYPYNSCSSDTLSNYSNGYFHTDVPDQIANFMDYGNEACSNEFTQGQANRMKAAIMTQRSGLLKDGCTAPCTENIIANFARDVAYPIPGNLITFTNTSSTVSGYQWLINDTVVSTNTNFSYTFNASGKYKVTLKAFNTPNCFAAYTDYVIVSCGVTARYYTNKKAIASKIPIYPDSIIFTNTSYNAKSYKWLISNDEGMTEHVVSTNTNLTYVFPTPANYNIRLVAFNGACFDTTEMYTVPVADPTPDGSVYGFADCYQQTKIKLTLCVDDYGFAPIPKNIPVNFYDSDPTRAGAHKLSPTFYLPDTIPGYCGNCYNLIIDVGYAHLDNLYLVFADSGKTLPVVLPNFPLVETRYYNNIDHINNINFHITAIPVTAVLEPGDTLRLGTMDQPNYPQASISYLWSDPYKLGCSACGNPLLNADSDRIKRVIATSYYGCKDTAYVVIKVPPADDYKVKINNVLCSSHDSMTVGFTLFNLFKRGIIPKDLKISFYNGNPKTSGATLLPPVFSVPAENLSMQKSYTTTIKIMPDGNLYAVVNDSSLVIPINLPNTLKLEKVYSNNADSIAYRINRKTIDTAICEGNAYHGYHTSGTYTDTLAGFKGCDSIRTLHLTVKPTSKTTISNAICAGTSFEGYTASGSYTDTFRATNGCDSTRILHLIVKPLVRSDVSATICIGKSYSMPSGANINSAGIYKDTVKYLTGCDSLITTVNLTVKAVSAMTMNPVICAGQTYTLYTRRIVNSTGIYTDTLRYANGCDSIITKYNLTVKTVYSKTIIASVCQGRSYILPSGAVVSNAGTYLDTVRYVSGCDSLITTVNLSVQTITRANINPTICEGQNYIMPSGTAISSAGTYLDTVRYVSGCDSLITMAALKVKPVEKADINAVICSGKIFTMPSGLIVNSTGIYADTFHYVSGCDSSIITVHLRVIPAIAVNHVVSLCYGEMYALPSGRIINATGIYIDTVKSESNCDSLITTINLIVNPNPSVIISKSNDINCIVGYATLTASGGSKYLWSPAASLNNAAIYNPIVYPSKTTMYRVAVTSPEGCRAEDSVQVNVDKGDAEGGYLLPTAFTPNKDGKNDCFGVKSWGFLTDLNFKVFNRQGEIVFSTTDPSKCWDGIYKDKPQATAAFVYYITANTICGRISRKGTIILIR